MKTKPRLARPFGAALIILLCAAGRSEAAVDIFLKLDGIPGGSTEVRHAGEIVLDSVSFGMANSGFQSLSSGRGAGKVQFTDITFTKKLDKSSPGIMSACMTGNHIKSATLTCRKAGGKQEDFYKVVLTDVMISGYSLSSGGDVPTESVSLNFSRVDWEYLIQRPDGSVVPGNKGSFDVKLNKANVISPLAPGGASVSDLSALNTRLKVLSSTISSQLAGGVRSHSVTTPSIFVKATGIEGEASDARHAREIEIYSFSWGMSNSAAMSAAGGAGAGKVQMNDTAQTKGIDKASIPLMLNCAQGSRIPEVLVSFSKPGTRGQDYLKVKLTNVLVSGIQQSGSSAGDLPMESLSLNYAKVEWEFFELRPDGTVAPAGKVGYDLALNKKI